MSEDLVYRLRNPKGQSGSDFNATYWLGISNEAADRIEELEGWLEGALNAIEHFINCDTMELRAVLDKGKKNDRNSNS